jgi:hypothetical protein
MEPPQTSIHGRGASVIMRVFAREAVTAKRIRAWSTEDVKSLPSLARARMSGPQIAKKLRRTPGAVNQKAFALGVRFRSVRTKKR